MKRARGLVGDVGKRKGRQRETAFIGLSADEIERRARDQMRPASERLRYVREAKYLKRRNVQERRKGKRGKRNG